MSIYHVRIEIERFLKSQNPEVICIRGGWGVGKTYCWKQLYKAAQEKNSIGLESYSYVSLFGVNSLENAHLSIFEGMISTNANASKVVSVKSIWDTILNSTKKLSSDFKEITSNQGSLWASVKRSLTASLHSGSVLPIQTLASIANRNMIVCFDDLERKGAGLSLRDLLGLVSNLKEERGCKILLLLNDNELDRNTNDKDEFEELNEKVIDVSMQFDPTPQECADIVFTDTDKASRLTAEACIALRIANIRVLRSIQRQVSQALGMLTSFHENVTFQAIRTITLFCWCHYEKNVTKEQRIAVSGSDDNAARTITAVPPTIDFILNIDRYGLALGRDNEADTNPLELYWSSLLVEYNFTRVDEFDRALLTGIQNGYFDSDQIREIAENLSKQFENHVALEAIEEAWRLYHDSFDDNGEEFITKLHSACMNFTEGLSVTGLDSSVRVLKDLERGNLAEEVLDQYMKFRSTEDTGFFDLEDYPFAGRVVDPDVRAAFKQRLEECDDTRSPQEVLIGIAKNNSWYVKDVKLLNGLTSDDFYHVLKSTSGTDIDRIVRVCRSFGEAQGTDIETKEIWAKVKGALCMIGSETLLNKRRVEQKYGVPVDQKETN